MCEHNSIVCTIILLCVPVCTGGGLHRFSVDVLILIPLGVFGSGFVALNFLVLLNELISAVFSRLSPYSMLLLLEEALVCIAS